MAPLRELSAIAERRHIPLIEDCAHSPGALREGRRAGSWGTLSCFSFYPTKNLGAAGDAGAVVTSDASLASRVRALRQYGWTTKYRSGLSGGRNSRLDEMQAAILRTKLPHLDRWNAERRAIAVDYCRMLAGADVILPSGPDGDDFVAHLFVIRSARREQIRRALEGAGIATDVHYPVPDHLQDSLRGRPARLTSLPVTERAVDEILTLPCFPELTREEVAEVSTRVRDSLR
jgi:dTDP-4-amino-4,6-dideoxygalactose transaminase